MFPFTQIPRRISNLIWCQIFGLNNKETDMSLRKKIDELGIKYKKLLIAKDFSMVCSGWAWILLDTNDDIDNIQNLFETIELRLIV